MKHCAHPACPWVKRHGAPSEFRDDVEVCADCGGALALGEARVPAPEEGEAPAQVHAPPWSALVVTVLVLLAPMLAARVPLPGLDQGELDRLEMFGGRASHVSAFQLGFAPILSAFAVVELIALVVPRWRALRHGGVTGRARLLRATTLLALALALLQGWALSRSLEGAGLLANPGLFSAFRVTLTLTAGTFVWVAVAALADRHALLGGYSLLLASEVVSELARAAQAAHAKLSSGEIAPSAIPVAALATGGAIAAAAWLLARKRASGELRQPASGIEPVSAVASVSTLQYTLMTFGLGGVVEAAWRDAPTEIAVAAGFAALYAYLFNRPTNVARFLGEGVGVTGAVLRAGAWSVAFVIGLATLQTLVLERGPLHLGVASLVVAAAVALDVRAEWLARRTLGELVALWPEHRVYAVDAALEGLARAGIPAYARGVHHRVLYPFFGPFLPIVFYVPVDHADEAGRVLSRVLGAPRPRTSGPYRREA